MCHRQAHDNKILAPIRKQRIVGSIGSNMFIEHVRRVTACLVYACAAAALTPGAHAVDSDSWRVNAFGTLGAAYSSDDDVKFVRDFFQTRGVKGEWSAEPDSVLGAQFSFRPSPEWEAVLQLVSRHDSTRDYDPRVTWAYVKFSPNPAFDLRVGRIGWDAFMRADSRNVGYTYLTVRPPIEYYGILALTHLDGGDVIFRRPVGDGVLSAKIFAGQADEETPSSAGGTYDLSGSEIVGGYLDWQWRGWQWRLGATTTKLERELPDLIPLISGLRGTGFPPLVELADDIAFEGARFNNWNLGVIYERGALQAQLLYNRRQIESILLSDGDMWFGLLAYRVGRLTPYLGHARSGGDSSPSDFALLGPSSAQALATGSLFKQRNWLAGLRYDVTNNVDLKLQVDRIDAPEPQGGLYSADPGWDGDTTVVSIALDFIY